MLCCLEEQRNEVVVAGLRKCGEKGRFCLSVCSRNEVTRPCLPAAGKDSGEGGAEHGRREGQLTDEALT